MARVVPVVVRRVVQIVALGLLCLLPAVASAQGTSTFAALRFGPVFGPDETGRSLEVLGGIEIAPGVYVSATLGRLNDVLSTSEGEAFALREMQLESQFGRDATVDASLPVVYALGGLRWSPPGDRLISPVIEVGAGVANVRLKFNEASAGGVDLTELLEAEFEESFNAAEFMVTAGGGLNVRVTPSVSAEMLYRFGRLPGDGARRIHAVYGGGAIVWR